ncbi:unnamed protein product [Rotaria sp. Silwood1]|nr:unnamed protein product [Rotaria sp. Silwood1]CAF3500373.1 unnamed protein product [Rotaria sp. Silwood1]CAF4574187.1 unnamed protein product [Rotaria sp. Silwood1]CAF4850279.1 unnamed protein product [Rotaria sp. Silwood1]
MREKKIFSAGDIFDDEFLNSVQPADYLYVGSFIHLFDAQTQREVCQRLTRLAKRAIAGRQAGASLPTECIRSTAFPSRKAMRHSPESFTQMWDEVTNHQWQVESVNLQTTDNMQDIRRRLTFVIRKRGEN